MNRLKVPKASGQRNKKAVSSIIGGIIIFGMIISIGYGYFYSIISSQQYYQKVVKLSNVAAQQREGEDLILTPGISGSSFAITAENIGPQLNITGYFVINNSTKTSNYYSITEGQVISQDDSHVFNIGTYTEGDQYLFKFLTLRGNVFTTTYPPIATSLAAQAISSGALGDLYLSFNSYTYFTVGTGGGCPTSSTYSGYCLSEVGTAFTIPYSGIGATAFSVTMTNLNSQHAEIVLDQFSLIYQVFPHARSGFYSQPWYIISNQSDAQNSGENAILSEYTPIVLAYDVPQTIVFASANCVTSSASNINDCSSGNYSSSDLDTPSPTGAGFPAVVYIMSHGWEGSNIAVDSLSYSSSNYGQNSPFVSTVYT